MQAQTATISSNTAVSAHKEVVVVNHLKIAFGANKVLSDFNMTLHQGENLVVLGRSGAGKSVLIKCIIGLLYPDEGEIMVFGNSIPELSEDELDKIRMRVGFLFQSNALYDSMTVRENLEFSLRRHGFHVAQSDMNDMVLEALDNVGLAYTVDMLPAELSGGMRKRIALARTLILKPEIILYDEPTTGLDPITGREISDLMLEVGKKYNASSIIISHDMRCIKHTADRIIVLLDGVCYAQGTYAELENSSDPNVHSFFE